ncbi:hypothetical protein BCR36DRAFT_1619 [Piromyces finnis]|uniref:Uncharacterized protein n=1 Tax=Piromyces finnis TaxID=1754191 RepID=A0A1Y1VN12_9FUNG|nr:hypothetical protein BCR36DRAFT_1619 [Piromyces finnis]|eukprot:ORX60818.1 hypothetical protein BCR36DRAFT_1619 [Piromyces finnis]
METNKYIHGVRDFFKASTPKSKPSIKSTVYDPNVTKRTVHYTEMLSQKDKVTYNHNSFQNENSSKEMNYSSSITRINSNLSPSLNNQSHTNYLSSVSASATLNNEIIPNMDNSLSSPIPPITPVNNNQTEPLISSFINSYSTSISSNIDNTNTPGIEYNSNNNIFKSYHDMNQEKDSDLCAYFENISFNDKSEENIGLSHAVFGDLTNSLPNFSKSYQNKSNANNLIYDNLLLNNYKNETEAIANEISLTESEKLNLQSTFKEMEDYQLSIKQYQSESYNNQKSSLDELLKTDFNKFVGNDESTTASITNTTITKESDNKENEEKKEINNKNDNIDDFTNNDNINDNYNYNNVNNNNDNNDNNNDNNNNVNNKNLILPELHTHYIDDDTPSKMPRKLSINKNEDKDLLEMIKDELLLKGSFSSINNNNFSESPSTNTTGLSTPTTTVKTNNSSGWNHPFLKNSESSNFTGISNPFTLQSSNLIPQSDMAPKGQYPSYGLSTPPVKHTFHTPPISPLQPLKVRKYNLSMTQPQECQQESISFANNQFSSGSIALENDFGAKTNSQSNLMPLNSFGVINKDSDIKGSINIGNSDAITLGKDIEAATSRVNPFLTFGDGHKVVRPDENEGYRGQMILTDIKDELNFNSFTSSFSSLNESKINSSINEQNRNKKEENKKKKEEEKKKKKIGLKKRKEERKKREEEKKRKKREEKKKKNSNIKEEKSTKNIFILNDDKNSLESLKDNLNNKVLAEENKKFNIISLRDKQSNDEKKNNSVSSMKEFSILSKSDSNANKYAFLEDYISNLNHVSNNAFPVITSPIQTPPHSPYSVLNPGKRGSDVTKIVNQRKSLLSSLPSPSYTDPSLSPGKLYMKRSSLLPTDDPDMDMSNSDAIPHRYSSISLRTRPIQPSSVEEEEIPIRFSSVSPKTRPVSRTSTSLHYSINSMMSNFNLPTSLSLVEGGILAPDSPSLLVKEKQCSLTTKPSNEMNNFSLTTKPSNEMNPLYIKSSLTNSYRSFSSELDQSLKKQHKHHHQFHNYNHQHKVKSNGSLSTSTTTTTATNSPLNHHSESRFGHYKDNDTESIESYESFSSELNESLKRQKHRSKAPTGHISPHTEAIEVKSQGSPYSNINSLNDLLHIKEYNADLKVNKARFSSSSYNLNAPATRKYGENRLSYYSLRPANRNSVYSNATTDTNENNLDFESFVEDLMNTRHHQKYDDDMNVENVISNKKSIDSSPSSKKTKLSSLLPSTEGTATDNNGTINRKTKENITTSNELISETIVMNKERLTASPEMNISIKPSPPLKINTDILIKTEESLKTGSPSTPFSPLSKLSINSNGDPTFGKRTTSLLSQNQREQVETMGKIALNKEHLTPKSPFKNVHGLEDIKEDDSIVIPPKPSVQVNDYNSSHHKSPSITSQSSIDSNGSHGSRASRNSAKRQAIYAKRTSISSHNSHHSYTSSHSRQKNMRNTRTSILKIGTTDSSDSHSPTPSVTSTKRVSISEKPQRIEYSYNPSFPLNTIPSTNLSHERVLSPSSESHIQNDGHVDGHLKSRKVEYTSIYPKRSSLVTNIGYGTPRSSSSNSVSSTSKIGDSYKSSNRISVTSSLGHPRKVEYTIKHSSLSTATITSSSSLGRPKKIEYRTSLLSSGSSSLNRPVKIDFLKKKRNSTGIVTPSSSYSGYAASSGGVSRSKSSREDYDSNKRAKFMRYGIESINSSSPTKERNNGLEKIKENEILDNSAEESFLLQCSLTSTSIDRLNFSFSKDTNINQSFSFSSLSGVAEFLNGKNNSIKAMIEKSKPIYAKEANSFNTSITTSSIVPPSGIIIGPDDLKERKIFSLSGNSSGYSSSYSTLSRFNQTISFASVSSIPDSAVNRNVKRVSCINLGLSNSSSSTSSTLGRHRHTLSTHVFISDFDSITSMSTNFKDHIKNVMTAEPLNDSSTEDSNSKSNGNTGSTPSQPLKSSVDESMINKVGGEEESFANSSASSIMKPYIPGFDNRNKSLSFSSSHLSSSIFNFLNKETIENQRLYQNSKKPNTLMDDAAALNLNANTSSNALNTSSLIPAFNGIHTDKINNFRKSDIFNINGKIQRHGNKYHSIATSNGYLTYLSEGENSFNNDSLLSNFSSDALVNEPSQSSTQAAEVNPSNVDNSYLSLNAFPPQFGTLKSTILGNPSNSILINHDPNQSHSSLKKITYDDSGDLTNSASHKAIKFKSSDTEDLPSVTTKETQSDGPRPIRIKELARQRMSMFNEINSILDRLCISNMAYEMDQRALPSLKFKTVNNFTHSLGNSNVSSLTNPYQPFFYNNLDSTSDVASLYNAITINQTPDHESSNSESDSGSEVHKEEPIDSPILSPSPKLPVIALEGKVLDTNTIVNKEKNKKTIKHKKSRGLMVIGKSLKKFKSFITGSNSSSKKKKVPMKVRTSSIYMDPEGHGVQYSIEKVVICEEEEANENTEFQDTLAKTTD